MAAKYVGNGRRQPDFSGYLSVPITGEDIAAILEYAQDVDTCLLEVCQYAEQHLLNINIKYDYLEKVWNASVYDNNPDSEYGGFGIRGTAETLPISIAVLSLKISRVGQQNWFAFATGKAGNVHGIK